MQYSHLKHGDVTGKVIECAMKVHKYFGSGFPEVVYHRALMIELNQAGFEIDSEVEKVVMYHDNPVGKRRIDLIVDKKVLLELKAISQIDNECYNQVLNCLRVFKLDVGLLMNFGKSSLEVRRFIRDVDKI